MARVKYVVKKQSTVKRKPRSRARFSTITQDKKSYEAARKRMVTRRTTKRNQRIMTTKEPEITVEVEPEIHLDVETQVEPPQLPTRG